MRRILVNRARDKARLKRGGGLQRVDVDLGAVCDEARDENLIALDAALEELIEHDPTSARLVSLRFFAGLGQGEAAAAMGLPRRTADRHWAYARAWLYERLQRDPGKA
jgi:RNA polymerase sigma factor (TIGR02999 family)